MGKYSNNPNVSQSKRTTNLAGGEAFQQDIKLEFASLVVTNLMKDQFYRTEGETVERIRTLMGKLDPRFVAKTAIYARHEFGMRSVTHFIAAEIAKDCKAKTWTKDFFKKVVSRPDDILEILSCYISLYKKPIPNALKRGLGKALEGFDAYAIAKYRKTSASLSLIDAANLIHPKATPVIDQLMKGTLPPAETWETKMTQAGQKAETEEEKSDLKAEAWRELISTGKIGYMALVRNLRNILEQVPDTVDRVCELLTDEARIQKSKMFPFRFLTAIDIIQTGNLTGAQKVLKALNRAVDLSLANVPRFEGKTLVVLDGSGSMTTGMVSTKSAAEVGSLFAATLVKAIDADFMSFSDDAKYQTLNTADSTLSIAKSIHFASGGTNFHAIFHTANRPYDRIIILSDMQGWVGHAAPTSTFEEYKKRLGCSPKIFSFDLCGHGTTQFPAANIFCLAGFSDKVFEIMSQLEEDRNALVGKIEAITLDE